MRGKLVAASLGEKGFVLTLEAGISILIFALLLFALPQQKSESMKELAAIQEANDLLRVWSAKTPTAQEMTGDLNGVFAGKAELWINEKEIISAQKTQNSIATEGALIDGALNENKVRIVVYYN